MPAINDPPAQPVQAVAVIDRSGGHTSDGWVAGLDPRELAICVEAYRGELDAICSAWNLPVPGLAVYTPHHQQQPTLEAVLLIVDSARDPNAYGAHTALGLSVWGYIDMHMCRKDGEPWTLVFGHELYEMIVDPYVNRWSGPYADGTHVAVEVSDPCQRASWTKTVNDPLLGGGEAKIADWVYPSWFEAGSSGPWSHIGGAPGPLQDGSGGYHLTMKDGKLVGGARIKAHGRSWRRVMA